MNVFKKECARIVCVYILFVVCFSFLQTLIIVYISASSSALIFACLKQTIYISVRINKYYVLWLRVHPIMAHLSEVSRSLSVSSSDLLECVHLVILSENVYLLNRPVSLWPL